LLVTAFGLLATTGYKGGEVVYRHGIGVMSMPVPSEDGSHASHEHETHTKEEKETQEQIKKIGSDIIDAEKDTHDDHSTHEHGAPKQEVKTNERTKRKKSIRTNTHKLINKAVANIQAVEKGVFGVGHKVTSCVTSFN